MISTIKILIVDDEKQHLTTYMELAEYLGCEAIGTQKYDEALEILKREGQNIHLLITDYEFQEFDNKKNGIALCKYAYKNLPHIQKIVVTVQPEKLLLHVEELKKIDVLIVKVINLYNELTKSVSRVRECIENTIALNQKNSGNFQN